MIYRVSWVTGRHDLPGVVAIWIVIERSLALSCQVNSDWWFIGAEQLFLCQGQYTIDPWPLTPQKTDARREFHKVEDTFTFFPPSVQKSFFSGKVKLNIDQVTEGDICAWHFFG